MTNVTEHAATRMRQRAISEQTVELLLEFGRRLYDHRGGIVHYFDKSCRRELQRRLGNDRYRQLEHELDDYLVTSTHGSVITVGHRDRRINRH